MMKTPLRRSLKPLLIVAAIVCGGAGLCSTFWPGHVAAQVRTPETPAPPGFFKSGAENVRAAEILSDIAQTLKQMDRRLERIEKMMANQTEKVIE